MVYEAQNRFKIRVGVLVFDGDNRLLLARQNNRPFWVLPGGTLEPGETMGECAVREIKEETGLDVTLGPLRFVGDFFTDKGQNVIDVIFASTLMGGMLTMETTENLNEIKFLGLQDVLKLDVRPKEAFNFIRPAWQKNQWPEGVYLGRYARST